ncbi:MAG: FxsA family protein, partial [Gemmatimonadota bacterium]
MLLRLFLLFTLVPLLELMLLLRIGAVVGLAPTLLLVLGTGVAGAWMARREGARSWQAVQSELAAGRFPGEQLLHSLLVLIAGIVLVTPGVLTDLAGILLLVPPVRTGLIRHLRRSFADRVEPGAPGPGPGWLFGVRAGARPGDDDGAEGGTTGHRAPKPHGAE